MVLAAQRGQVLRPDVPEVLQVFRLRLVTALDPLDLLRAVILDPVHLKKIQEPRQSLRIATGKNTLFIYIPTDSPGPFRCCFARNEKSCRSSLTARSVQSLFSFS